MDMADAVVVFLRISIGSSPEKVRTGIVNHADVLRVGHSGEHTVDFVGLCTVIVIM